MTKISGFFVQFDITPICSIFLAFNHPYIDIIYLFAFFEIFCYNMDNITENIEFIRFCIKIYEVINLVSIGNDWDEILKDEFYRGEIIPLQPEKAFDLNSYYMVNMIIRECAEQ